MADHELDEQPASQANRWAKIEQPGGEEIRLKRRHWCVGDIATRQGIAIVFGSDDSHASLIAAATELLAMVRRYASECAECNGEGQVAQGEGYLREWVPCSECADIRALITKAGGAS